MSEVVHIELNRKSFFTDHVLSLKICDLSAITITKSLPFFSILQLQDDDDEFRFNDASTHEGHLRQNGELTWFCNETIIMISHKCIKCKTRTNLKTKAVILC